MDCKHDVTGNPGVVQYVYSDPNLQRYPQFFVGGQSPGDIRHHHDHAIRCMCQTLRPNQQAQDTPSDRMAIVLMTFILAVQEILDLLYLRYYS